MSYPPLVWPTMLEQPTLRDPTEVQPGRLPHTHLSPKQSPTALVFCLGFPADLMACR